MMKLIVIAYTSALGFLNLLILLMQDILPESTNAIVQSNEVLGRFNFWHPALGVLGQLIYISLVFHKKLDVRLADKTVDVWSVEETQMAIIRIFLAAVIGFLISFLFEKILKDKNLFGFGEVGVYAFDLVIGYYIIKGTKKDFDDKAFEKLKGKI